MGCYLDDLVLVPINKKSKTQRRRAWKENKDSLSQRIRENRPMVVICLMRTMADTIQAAASAAGVERFDCVYFPGNGQQARFLADMRRILPELVASKVIERPDVGR